MVIRRMTLRLRRNPWLRCGCVTCNATWTTPSDDTGEARWRIQLACKRCGRSSFWP